MIINKILDIDFINTEKRVGYNFIIDNNECFFIGIEKHSKIEFYSIEYQTYDDDRKEQKYRRKKNNKVFDNGVICYPYSYDTQQELEKTGAGQDHHQLEKTNRAIISYNKISKDKNNILNDLKSILVGKNVIFDNDLYFHEDRYLTVSFLPRICDEENNCLLTFHIFFSLKLDNFTKYLIHKKL